jgi:hypothetical protein
MFDPSKLDLDLDENKGKKDANLLQKTESEKIEEHKQVSKSDNSSDIINSSDDLDFLIQSESSDSKKEILMSDNGTETSTDD